MLIEKCAPHFPLLIQHFQCRQKLLRLPRHYGESGIISIKEVIETHFFEYRVKLRVLRAPSEGWVRSDLKLLNWAARITLWAPNILPCDAYHTKGRIKHPTNGSHTSIWISIKNSSWRRRFISCSMSKVDQFSLFPTGSDSTAVVLLIVLFFTDIKCSLRCECVQHGGACGYPIRHAPMRPCNGCVSSQCTLSVGVECDLEGIQQAASFTSKLSVALHVNTASVRTRHSQNQKTIV